MNRKQKPEFLREEIVMKAFYLLLVLLCNNLLHARVQPAHIFSNNMVLQRGKPVKVWGTASPQEKVKVEFAGQINTAVANKAGDWFMYLEPMDANAVAAKMIISGKDRSIVYANVLVGDVWVLGGQSNMEFDLARIFHGDAEILSANFPLIRLMTIPSSANLKPKKDFEAINEYDSWSQRYDKKGEWFICSPQNSPNIFGMGLHFRQPYTHGQPGTYWLS